MNPKRIRILKTSECRKGPILYWMNRDQRLNDNWALIHAQELANQKEVPLIVCFCLVPSFLDATLRQYDFMIKGLKELEKDLEEKNIPFILLTGEPENEIPLFIDKIKASMLITDFNPLKIKKHWLKKIIKKIKISCHEVDAHNIVPVWEASDKKEYMARTLRTKIERKLDEFLVAFPEIEKHKYSFKPDFQKNNWNKAIENLKIDKTIKPVDWLNPGEKNAKKILKIFIDDKINKYSSERNNPNKDAVSNLSPYLHFGQISSQRVAIEINNTKKHKNTTKEFLEELIIRKELSDNFCFYCENYDSTDCLANWAKETLKKHSKDKRKYIYSLEELENAKTHDDLWNASQIEMIKKGKMHGYMRMYWAKKILEWTNSPDEALKTAIFLNDKYELDGRDPNGYVGILWSIGGLHDRAWKERDIFGKVRYMSYNGAKNKFDINKYIEQIENLHINT